MAFQNWLFLALVLATYPAHALDLKKELERLRGGADATETQTQAVPAAEVPRTVNGTGHTGPSEFCATSI